MKKLLVVTTLLTLTGSAMAAHGPAGCGLGSVLFKGQEGLVSNVLAATFNGSSGNQTFGMSSGTLGCEDAQTAKVSAVSFVEANTVALANDIARGQGETLNTYLSMVKKDKADKKVLRKHYKNIFAKGNTAKQIHERIISHL